MTTRTKLFFFALVSLGLNLFSVQANADIAKINKDVAYSATRIIQGGEHRMEQRYFQKDGETNRMEMYIHDQQATIIMNGERGVMWMLMPGQRMYWESPIDGQPFDGTNVEVPDPATWVMEREGRESVNGIPATRYRVATDAGEVTRMRGHLWISDHGIPVRTDMVTGGDRIQMELRDLVVGPQPAELFVPTPGYQVMAFGADFPGGPGMPGGVSGFPGLGMEAAGAYGTAPAEGGSGFVGELATEATEEAKRATTQEVRRTVNESVRKGIRNILK